MPYLYLEQDIRRAAGEASDLNDPGPLLPIFMGI